MEIEQRTKKGNGNWHSNMDGGVEDPKAASSSNFIIDLCTPPRSPNTDYSSIRKAKKTIGRYFYESGIDFSSVDLPSFHRMLSLSSGLVKYEFPTRDELKGWILESAVKEMKEQIKRIRSSWDETGCSVLLDEWTDIRGRNLVNILVECPKGAIYLRSDDISDFIGKKDLMLLFLEEVVAEVGEENVVQIMTSSTTAFMKEIGKELMDRIRPIHWTFSVWRCIELMLEKFCKINFIEKTLEKVKTVARFVLAHPETLKFDLVEHPNIQSTVIVPFLIIDKIVSEKETMMEMCFPSDLTSSVEGKEVSELLASESFWTDVSIVRAGTIPLIRIVLWMNSMTKEQFGYIYEMMDLAKEAIQAGFKRRGNQYLQFWKVIDEVWDGFLHTPLHSAAYFLNPQLYYSGNAYIDTEVDLDMLSCVVRSTKDHRIQDKITLQMEEYIICWDVFGSGWSVAVESDISIVQWWHEYGVKSPELQRLAIRILNQMCDGASKFHLNRSLAERAVCEGRNRSINQKRAFLHYNMHLQNFASGKTDYILADAGNAAVNNWIATG
ncbi:uncharacterized protein LOC127243876 [Andrographis paniculata]|uniref:uncharacterized protein LOC127243876 n=1 Tax=Andrographis paniculata TaxID=175694 RepID=UPI0021E8FADF|nr:uncharacterized protein LOC127243876 [Andrographis paniculata]